MALLYIEGKHYVLEPNSLHLIGRKCENATEGSITDIELNCESVDDKHALLKIKNDAVHLIDLKSKCGTFIDDKRADFAEQIIKNNESLVRFGKVQCKLQLQTQTATDVQNDSSGFDESVRNISDKVSSSPEVSSTKATTNTFGSFLIPQPKPQQNNERKSLSFNIPDTQQCMGNSYKASELEDTSIADSECTFLDKSKRDDMADVSDDFCIPETQEILSEHPKRRSRAVTELSPVPEQPPTELWASQDFGSQIRMCTQDFNENNDNSRDSTDSDILLASAIIPYIQHPAVMLNTSQPLEKKQTENVNEDEDAELCGLNWNTNNSSQQAKENAERADTCTPDLFDDPQLMNEKPINIVSNERLNIITPDNVMSSAAINKTNDIEAERRVNTGTPDLFDTSMMSNNRSQADVNKTGAKEEQKLTVSEPADRMNTCTPDLLDLPNPISNEKQITECEKAQQDAIPNSSGRMVDTCTPDLTDFTNPISSDKDFPNPISKDKEPEGVVLEPADRMNTCTPDLFDMPMTAMMTPKKNQEEDDEDLIETQPFHVYQQKIGAANKSTSVVKITPITRKSAATDNNIASNDEDDEDLIATQPFHIYQQRIASRSEATTAVSSEKCITSDVAAKEFKNFVAPTNAVDDIVKKTVTPKRRSFLYSAQVHATPVNEKDEEEDDEDMIPTQTYSAFKKRMEFNDAANKDKNTSNGNKNVTTSKDNIARVNVTLSNKKYQEAENSKEKQTKNLVSNQQNKEDFNISKGTNMSRYKQLNSTLVVGDANKKVQNAASFFEDIEKTPQKDTPSTPTASQETPDLMKTQPLFAEDLNQLVAKTNTTSTGASSSKHSLINIDDDEDEDENGTFDDMFDKEVNTTPKKIPNARDESLKHERFKVAFPRRTPPAIKRHRESLEFKRQMKRIHKKWDDKEDETTNKKRQKIDDSEEDVKMKTKKTEKEMSMDDGPSTSKDKIQLKTTAPKKEGKSTKKTIEKRALRSKNVEETKENIEGSHSKHEETNKTEAYKFTKEKLKRKAKIQVEEKKMITSPKRAKSRPNLNTSTDENIDDASKKDKGYTRKNKSESKSIKESSLLEKSTASVDKNISENAQKLKVNIQRANFVANSSGNMTTTDTSTKNITPEKNLRIREKSNADKNTEPKKQKNMLPTKQKTGGESETTKNLRRTRKNTNKDQDQAEVQLMDTSSSKENLHEVKANKQKTTKVETATNLRRTRRNTYKDKNEVPAEIQFHTTSSKENLHEVQANKQKTTKVETATNLRRTRRNTYKDKNEIATEVVLVTSDNSSESNQKDGQSKKTTEDEAPKNLRRTRLNTYRDKEELQAAAALLQTSDSDNPNDVQAKPKTAVLETAANLRRTRKSTYKDTNEKNSVSSSSKSTSKEETQSITRRGVSKKPETDTKNADKNSKDTKKEQRGASKQVNEHHPNTEIVSANKKTKNTKISKAEKVGNSKKSKKQEDEFEEDCTSLTSQLSAPSTIYNEGNSIEDDFAVGEEKPTSSRHDSHKATTSSSAKKSRVTNKDATADKSLSTNKLKIATSHVDMNLISGVLEDIKELVTVVNEPTEFDALIMDKPVRTFKFFVAMALGKPILNSRWLACVKKHKRTRTGDELQYFIATKAFEQRYKFTMTNSMKLANTKPKILAGYEFLATPNILPKPSEMKVIIECAGGTFHTKMPKNKTQHYYLLSNTQDKQQWHSFRRQYEKLDIIDVEAVNLVVMRQSLLPLNEYIIG